MKIDIEKLPLETANERLALRQNPLTDSLDREAILCAWEHVTSKYYQKPNGFESFGGAVAARHETMTLGPAIHYGYHIALHASGDCYSDAYDWEFVPWFIENCFDQSHGSFDLYHDWVARCREHGQQHKEKTDKRIQEYRDRDS